MTAGPRKARQGQFVGCDVAPARDLHSPKRETFAYSCEAFARMVERARGSGERAELVEAFAADFWPSEARIDAVEVSEILREAAARRNGWKVILARCAPRR